MQQTLTLGSELPLAWEGVYFLRIALEIVWYKVWAGFLVTVLLGSAVSMCENIGEHKWRT